MCYHWECNEFYIGFIIYSLVVLMLFHMVSEFGGESYLWQLWGKYWRCDGMHGKLPLISDIVSEYKEYWKWKRGGRKYYSLGRLEVLDEIVILIVNLWLDEWILHYCLRRSN